MPLVLSMLALPPLPPFLTISFILAYAANEVERGSLLSTSAFTQPDSDQLTTIWLAIGAVGAAFFLDLRFFHLYTAERDTFYAVLIIALAVFFTEMFYFERNTLTEEIPYIEPDIEEATD